MTYELKRSSAIGWSFVILQGDEQIGTLDFKLLRSAGTLTLNGATYQITREGLFGAFIMSADGHQLARAENTALLRARYRVTAEDRQLRLAAKGFLQRSAEVFHGDVVMSTIGRASVFRRGVRVEDSAILPLPTVMFCAAVMILYWRRRSRRR